MLFLLLFFLILIHSLSLHMLSHSLPYPLPYPLIVPAHALSFYVSSSSICSSSLITSSLFLGGTQFTRKEEGGGVDGAARGKVTGGADLITP